MDVFARACLPSAPFVLCTFSTPDPSTQIELRRSDERKERTALNPVESLVASGAPGVGGGHRLLRGGCAVAPPRPGAS
jgi:hypothetical protein